jgi:nucleotide-binding universal stress UspA family protein
MRIMLATDGSEHAALAETVLAKFPGLAGSSVDVVSVSTPLPILGVGVPAIAEPTYTEQSTELWQELHAHAEKVAREAAERLSAAGFQARHVVLDGDIAGELLDYSEREPVDLVIVGSRGENALAAMLLGSVARKMVAHCKKSVLVVRTYDDKTPEESSELLRSKDPVLLIGVDAGDGAQAAVRWIKARGPGYGRVIAMSVDSIPYFPATIGPAVAALAFPESEDALPIAEKAAEDLEGIAPKVEALRAHGHASAELVRAAREMSADFIAVGATRHGVIQRFLIGSVAYDVAAGAPCSVLVVRP